MALFDFGESPPRPRPQRVRTPLAGTPNPMNPQPPIPPTAQTVTPSQIANQPQRRTPMLARGGDGSGPGDRPPAARPGHHALRWYSD